jgi:hypothetical protein
MPSSSPKLSSRGRRTDKPQRLGDAASLRPRERTPGLGRGLERDAHGRPAAVLPGAKAQRGEQVAVQLIVHARGSLVHTGCSVGTTGQAGSPGRCVRPGAASSGVECSARPGPCPRQATAPALTNNMRHTQPLWLPRRAQAHQKCNREELLLPEGQAGVTVDRSISVIPRWKAFKVSDARQVTKQRVK